MTIELRNFSSETSATHPHVQSVKGFTTKLFLRIFLNSVIYETFPIQNFYVYGIYRDDIDYHNNYSHDILLHEIFAIAHP